MGRYAWVVGTNRDMSEAICRRLARLDHETSLTCDDEFSDYRGIQLIIASSEEGRRPIDICVIDIAIPFERIAILAEAMAQRGWGRVVLIEWIEDCSDDAEAAQRGRQDSIRRLGSQLVSRGVTINTIVTSRESTQAGEFSSGYSASERMSKNEEIAGLAAYFTSDEAGSLTGARIAFDVGRRLN
jgi:NAD(P)-dependent dehydrogenase (short-subunit alcohol dehydrogenase family)